MIPDGGAKQLTNRGAAGHVHRDCKCGATRVDAQLGLEPTLAEYIENMCLVFDEVWRVLRDDGTCWVNMGDSYATTPNGRSAADVKAIGNDDRTFRDLPMNTIKGSGLKPKDLMGVPWRLAFALQERGWYLRSDIIWHKPNPMPESVTDRPTKSHEYIFLLAKNKSYYYDADAIREGLQQSSIERAEHAWNGRMVFDENGKESYRSQPDPTDKMGDRWAPVAGRNKRTVWTVTTKPYSGAHFATFPPDLIEPCILAGTSEKGQCPECGAPWERVVDKKKPPDEMYVGTSKPKDIQAVWKTGGMGQKLQNWYNENPAQTTGWCPTCEHDHEPVPQIVLDPFGGSGTTAQVAQAHGRIGICLDLSWEYLVLAQERCGIKQMREWTNGKKAVESNLEGLPLFKEAE